jgi:Carbohydrate esterase 2 N-terminal/GDSL-like Lipase/Acylhydrolase family
MVQRLLILLISLAPILFLSCKTTNTNQAWTGNFFEADNPNIQYTGRIDFSNPKLPRFWSPGVYITARFKGPVCSFIINDEVLWGSSHNYLEVVVDDQKPVRLQLKGTTDTVQVAAALSKRGEHTVLICKNTESGIGYLEFVGFQCKELIPPPAKPLHKIEFIGNSITCGAGMDLTVVPCNAGQWYDQHNAWMSYGPVTARALNAQWQLSAVSGIGLMHSCCNMTITMPQVFDKLNMRTDSIAWNFTQYTPDVVTVCMGQNDGIRDSIAFVQAYITFLGQVRGYYPLAQIICLTSPMGDTKLTAVLKNYIDGTVSFMNRRGDKKVSRYFFSRQFHNGCGGHPDLAEHQVIAGELSAYIKNVMNW